MNFRRETSGQTPFPAGNSTQESSDRIRVSVLTSSYRFRVEPDKPGHRICSQEHCFHVLSTSGVFLRAPTRTSRPGLGSATFNTNKKKFRFGSVFRSISSFRFWISKNLSVSVRFGSVSKGSVQSSFNYLRFQFDSIFENPES